MAYSTCAKSNSLSIAYLLQKPGILLSTTGAKTHVMHIIDGLQAAGHKVTLLGIQGRSIIHTNSVDEIKYRNSSGVSGTWLFKFIESVVRRAQTGLNFPYLGIFNSFRFYEACLYNGNNIDVFHQRQGVMDIGGALASKRLDIPLVLEVNSDPLSEYEYLGSPLVGVQKITTYWMAKIIYKYSSAIFCVSEAVKKNLETRWGVPSEKLLVIPNAVDVHRFRITTDRDSIRQKLGLHEELVIVFISGFQDWHDHGLLMESFNIVRNKISGVKLMLVGDGPNLSKVQKKIEELDLKKHVLLTGAVDANKIPTLLYASDVAVAPIPKSTVEFWGSPMKIFEYMAAGRAIVASRAGQVADIIKDGLNGLSVDPGNVDAFADAIIRLLENPSLREYLGKNAREEASKNHTLDGYINKLVDLYLNLIR
jgi:glycosyltransferase involved in cell wall biosynthesis